jgi:polysaccharide biosynthesis/export protein
LAKSAFYSSFLLKTAVMPLLRLSKAKFKYAIFLLLAGLFGSCVPTKNLVYMQKINRANQAKEEITITAPLYSYVIATGDMVGIEISSFNKTGINNIGENLNNKPVATDPLANGYLVDTKGNIQVPLIGDVKVVGLSIPQAQELIATKAADYINNVIVKVRLLSFYVTILGEVGKPGRINVTTQSINIFEALSLAGDLQLTSNYQTVRVIRIKDDKATTHYLDLNSNNVFHSEVFYLKPGDLVYVEPTKVKVTQNNLVPLTIGTTIVTTALFILNILIATKVIK